MTQQWRAAVGFEGFYEVSERGDVRSVDRLSRCRNDKGRALYHKRKAAA